jgi:hypothetical protein
VGGKHIKGMRCADDQRIVAGTEHGLQKVMYGFTETSKLQRIF